MNQQQPRPQFQAFGGRPQPVQEQFEEEEQQDNDLPVPQHQLDRAELHDNEEECDLPIATATALKALLEKINFTSPEGIASFFTQVETYFLSTKPISDQKKGAIVRPLIPTLMLPAQHLSYSDLKRRVIKRYCPLLPPLEVQLWNQRQRFDERVLDFAHRFAAVCKVNEVSPDQHIPQFIRSLQPELQRDLFRCNFRCFDEAIDEAIMIEALLQQQTRSTLPTKDSRPRNFSSSRRTYSQQPRQKLHCDTHGECYHATKDCKGIIPRNSREKRETTPTNPPKATGAA